MPLKRRELLFGAAIAAVVLSVPPLLRRYRVGLQTRPIDGMPGFRRLDLGGISGGNIALIGLDDKQNVSASLTEKTRRTPCASLFGPGPYPAGRVPVAVFTDYNCPYCSRVSEMVMELRRSGAPIDITWHDLPVLGPRSEAAARAAVAAGMQDVYEDVHRHLMHTNLRPGPAALRTLAEKFGMDADQFVADVAGATVEHQLAATRASAAVFGIVGTPGTMVGRTLAMGAISKQSLRGLIDDELKSGSFAAICTSN